MEKAFKNPLKISEVDVKIFDVFDIDSQEYIYYIKAKLIIEDLGMEFVKIVVGHLSYKELFCYNHFDEDL